MSATEILEADLERDERRKSKPFRREWAVSNVSTLSSKSDFVQNENIALSFVGTNILHHESTSWLRKNMQLSQVRAFLMSWICPPMMLIKYKNHLLIFLRQTMNVLLIFVTTKVLWLFPCHNFWRKLIHLFWIKILVLKIRNCFPLPLKKWTQIVVFFKYFGLYRIWQSLYSK